ncbi:Xaa-Pro aminopeptidase [Phytophthora megakarya]|uniref:Xaa-Pro aminopeptidase n=1 Tax=Phytophthora megakarya TaxID=4795 RepID=A0A225WN57_9STRA|nr:Xaa-Pro aminopeptidase [Phytophthora megakarya]
MREKDAHTVVLTVLDDIAWLFNIRGNDVQFNSGITSYAVVTPDTATLFVNAAIQEEMTQHLSSSGVECKSNLSMLKEISTSTVKNKEKEIRVDPAQCGVAVFLAIPAANRKEGTSVVMAKNDQNAIEIEGMRQSHLRDCAALVNYFNWLEQEMKVGQEDQWDEDLVAHKTGADSATGEGLRVTEFRHVLVDVRSIIRYSRMRGEYTRMPTSPMYQNDSGAPYLDNTMALTNPLLWATYVIRKKMF